MPFPNEHSCRLVAPSQFVRIRRKTGRPDVLIGFRDDGSSEAQAFRYPTSSWAMEDAASHCRKHGGKFEAAKTPKEKKGDQS